jgi:hypothetical protein
MSLNALLQEFLQNPFAFCTGFLTGALRLDPESEPLRSWLEQQGITVPPSAPSSAAGQSGSQGPQSISID